MQRFGAAIADCSWWLTFHSALHQVNRSSFPPIRLCTFCSLEIEERSGIGSNCALRVMPSGYGLSARSSVLLQ
jgi:hypothetical protein